MSLHNKDNFLEFLRLKSLLENSPIDKKLLKVEIKNNYYFKSIKTLADVKRHLENDFEENFFSRKTAKFFKTRGYKFSKKYMTITCLNGHGESVYKIAWGSTGLILKSI